MAPNDPASRSAPGRTEDFKVTLGPLPQADRVVFKALQHYADGQVVRWIQDRRPDDERPAAILDLSGGAGEADSGTTLWPWLVLAAVVLVAGALLLRLRKRAQRVHDGWHRYSPPARR